MDRPHPSFRDALRVWALVGLNSFGGPAGQIAVMHRMLVEERRWIGEDRYLHALNFCMLLPGPEAQQLAVYVGWLLHRVRGGIAAGVLFVLPGALIMLALSIVYARYRHLPAMDAIFFGLKPAVLAVVVEALVRIGRRALRGRVHVAIAAAAFVALFFFAVPFPVVIVLAGLIGALAARVAPRGFGAPAGAGGAGLVDTILDGAAPVIEPSLGRSLRVIAVCTALWFGPVLLLAALLGRDHVVIDEAVFFSQAAVVTFGGAYAVLAYIAQAAVDAHGWLRPGEMLDGLGLAETTPGPLIMVVQFVGFLGAYRNPGVLSPMTAGILGALATTWVTFVPCFLWIFLGAPSIERLRGRAGLQGALAAITAAVVGVIFNLSVWFALHTLFARVDERTWGPVRVQVPDAGTLDPWALAIAVAAAVALFRFKLGMIPTLALAAAAGLLIRSFV